VRPGGAERCLRLLAGVSVAVIAQRRPHDCLQGPHPIPCVPAWLEDAADDVPFAVDHVVVMRVAGVVAQVVARASKLERNLRHSVTCITYSGAKRIEYRGGARRGDQSGREPMTTSKFSLRDRQPTKTAGLVDHDIKTLRDDELDAASGGLQACCSGKHFAEVVIEVR